VIGISGPDRGGFVAWLFASWSVRRAGGKPLRLTPSRGLPDRVLDGLIVGGGADVEPSRYDPEEVAPPIREQLEAQKGARSKLRFLAGYLLSPLIFVLRSLFRARYSGIDPSRDTLEIALIVRAVEEGAPVLGICRGAQLLNVCFGGTLHRDLSSFYEEHPARWTPFPRKRIVIAPHSRLRDVLDTTQCLVNSLHRQAVDRLGTGIHISAQEPNCVVQAIEYPDHPFLIGVQWHPEYLPQRPEQRRLFHALVRAAHSHRASSTATRALRSTEQLLVDLAVAQKDSERIDQPEHR
jgi:putative glutamine amidotransferase